MAHYKRRRPKPARSASTYRKRGKAIGARPVLKIRGSDRRRAESAEAQLVDFRETDEADGTDDAVAD